MQPPSVRQGDIYWLDNCRPLHGNVAKRRPIVVVSPNDELEKSPDALIVACTSSALLSDVTLIELPSRERMPQTKSGLNRRTWAVPTWLLPVQKSQLAEYIGHLSGTTLRRLLEAVQNAQSE